MRVVILLSLTWPAISLRQANNVSWGVCDWPKRCCETPKCDGQRESFDHGSNVEGAKLYECKATPGPFLKPKRTYGAYTLDDKPITSKEMNEYITVLRGHKVLSQLPESSYVCQETCAISYPGENTHGWTTRIKVYRSGGVDGFEGAPPLCVKERPRTKPAQSFRPVKLEVSKKDKLKAKLSAFKAKFGK